MTKQEILNYLSSHKEKFHNDYGVVKIGLFGSFARDQATLNSDIDLVIEMNPKSFEKRIAFKREIESDLNRSLDVGYMSALRSFIAKEVAKDIIYV
jgi:uncharacterized protein